MSQICFLNMQNMNLPVPFLFCKTLIFVCFREIMWHSPFLLSCCCCCCCCCMWSPSWTQLDWGKEGFRGTCHAERNCSETDSLHLRGVTCCFSFIFKVLFYFSSISGKIKSNKRQKMEFVSLIPNPALEEIQYHY